MFRTDSSPEIGRKTPFDALPQFLSPEEARAWLDLSRSGIYEALRRGDIKHRRFGRLIRIPKDALATVMAR